MLLLTTSVIFTGSLEVAVWNAMVWLALPHEKPQIKIDRGGGCVEKPNSARWREGGGKKAAQRPGFFSSKEIDGHGARTG